MKIGVISNGTFSEEHYREFFSANSETEFCGICSVDERLPEGQYDVIVVDYYNENFSPAKLNYLSEEHPESIIMILADVDLENDNFQKEEKILKKFAIDNTTCFNIKEDNNAHDFYEYAKVMIDIKNETESAEAPFSISVILYVLAFLAIVILGLIHYLH